MFRVSTGVGSSPRLALYNTILTFNDPKAFENNLGKGENAGNQHFLLFPKCFLTIPKTNFNFFMHIYCVVCKAFEF